MKGLAQQLRSQPISLTVAFVALVFSVTGAAVASSVITSKQIKNGSITSADLARGAVRSADIARGQVQAADIGRGQVRAASIGSDQVTAAAIAANGVGAEQLAPDSVGAGEVAPSAVDSAAIEQGAVQSGDIANGQINTEDIGEGQVTPGDVTMPAPMQFQRPAREPASVDINAEGYALVAAMGTYSKQDGGSTLEVSWTGTAGANSLGGSSACVFQLRVDGQTSRGAGEVFVAPGPAISVSATALFEALPAGAHQVEIWARLPNYGGGTFTCTVGPDSTDIAQTVVVSEKVV